MVDNEKVLSFHTRLHSAQCTLLTDYEWDLFEICFSFHRLRVFRLKLCYRIWALELRSHHVCFIHACELNHPLSLCTYYVHIYKTKLPEDYHNWLMPFELQGLTLSSEIVRFHFFFSKNLMRKWIKIEWYSEHDGWLKRNLFEMKKKLCHFFVSIVIIIYCYINRILCECKQNRYPNLELCANVIRNNAFLGRYDSKLT